MTYHKWLYQEDNMEEQATANKPDPQAPVLPKGIAASSKAATFIEEKAARQPRLSARTDPETVRKLFEEQLSRSSDPSDWLGIEGVLYGIREIEICFEHTGYSADKCQYGWGSLLGPRMFGDVAGVGCFVHDDYEHPVYFIVYLDADGGTLMAYMPKEGNTYNYDTDAAFGHDREKDVRFLSRWLEENVPGAQYDPGMLDPAGEHGRLMFSEEKILRDIAKNITVAG